MNFSILQILKKRFPIYYFIDTDSMSGIVATDSNNDTVDKTLNDIKKAALQQQKNLPLPFSTPPHCCFLISDS